MIYLEKKRGKKKDAYRYERMRCKYCVKYLPVIGLRFISLARSLDASCHSLVNVLGGGAANNEHKYGKLDEQTEMFLFV